MGLDNQSSDQDEENAKQERSMFAQDFERAVSRARWFGLAERVWERAVPTLGGLSAVFLTASWSGVVWPNMPPAMRAASVLILGVAALASAVSLLKVKKPGRREAIDRLDHVNNGDRAASTYDDIPADEENMTDQSRAVWNFERRRIERSVGSFKAGVPVSSMARRDPFAIRMMGALAVTVTLFGAYMQDEALSRLTDAFDWSIASPHTDPVQVDAWVNSPDYTGQAPLYIASKENVEDRSDGQSFSVPAQSILTVVVHERNVTVSIGGITPDDACTRSSTGAMTRCEFELSEDALVSIQRGNETPLTWDMNVRNDNPPELSISPASEGTQDEQGITLQYELTDEYDGATIPEVEITPVEPADPASQTLPIYRLPNLRIPVQ